MSLSKDEKYWLVGGIVGGVFAILFFLFLFCLTKVEAGHVGVVSSFGSVQEEPLKEGGLYLVAPWKVVDKISSQTTRNEEPATVPTKGGLSVTLKAVLLYRVDPLQAPRLKREVGFDFEQKVIDPYFKNAVRDVCAEYDPEALYTAARNEVESKVFERISHELISRGIIVEEVMLQEPELPSVVKERIEAKIAAEQDALRMQSVFKQREQEAMATKRQKELEADAKIAEAKGISEAQKIIKADLDDNYLRYLWIEALKESSKNHNTTIYVPTGIDGMPLFKNVREGK